MRRLRRLLLSLLVVAALRVSPAAAQSTEANLLFDEGRKAIANRDYLLAIEKLRQSQKLDPAVGTLLNLAECYAILGRTASAWSTYRDAASLAFSTKQTERHGFAKRKAQELEPTLSRLELVIKPEARVRGLSITRNGVEVPEALWGSAIPVDPGAQHIEAQAAGYQTWKFDVDVGESGARAAVEVPALVQQAGASPAVAPVAAPQPAPAASPAPVAAAPASFDTEDAAPSKGLPLKTLGWAGAATGVVAAGVGLYFYTDGRGKIDDANCPNQICVRGIGDKDLHDSGRAREKLGGGLAIAGAVIAAAGLVLVLSAPDEPESASRLQLKWAGSRLDLQARF